MADSKKATTRPAPPSQEAPTTDQSPESEPALPGVQYRNGLTIEQTTKGATVPPDHKVDRADVNKGDAKTRATLAGNQANLREPLRQRPVEEDTLPIATLERTPAGQVIRRYNHPGTPTDAQKLEEAGWRDFIDERNALGGPDA